MRIEQKYNLTWLYPGESKVLVKVGEESGGRYKSLVLARDDSPENYTEIDTLTPEIPVDPEMPPVEIIPDPDGKINYEDAKKLMDTIAAMQERVVDLQQRNDMLTECLLEMSEVVYNV